MTPPWVWRGAVRCARHGVAIVITTLRRYGSGELLGQVSWCPRCPPRKETAFPLRIGDRREGELP